MIRYMKCTYIICMSHHFNLLFSEKDVNHIHIQLHFIIFFFPFKGSKVNVSTFGDQIHYLFTQFIYFSFLTFLFIKLRSLTRKDVIKVQFLNRLIWKS